MITDNAVFSDRVTINAPASLVWEVLLDFDAYAEWNPFCPEIKAESLALGTPVEMMVDLGGDGLEQQVEYVSRVDPERCISWRMENQPDDPVHAERSQHIEVLDEHSCVYWSVDDFSGPGVAQMMELMAGAVETGFNRCAYGLKERVENLYKTASNS